jgi:hypothetical protein
LVSVSDLITSTSLELQFQSLAHMLRSSVRLHWHSLRIAAAGKRL